jgi:sugar lactone lactonase YvrE
LGLFLLIGTFWTISPALAFECSPFVPSPRPKQIGVLAKNHKLRKVVFIAKGKVKGPEDIAFDKQGRIYTGSTFDGKVYRITPATADGAKEVQVFADPGGGMTLGLMFDQNENLIACNCPKGLLSLDKEGKVTTLVDRVGDQPVSWTDDLDIASDGKIYFSDASRPPKQVRGYDSMFLDLLGGNAWGKLLVYDPISKETRTLLKDLYFANGVALSKDEDYVLVNETFRYRVHRFWLKGPKAGSDDIFADNLPGMPDGINRDSDGNYWVCLVAPRTAYMDYVQARPKLKKLFSHLPKFTWGRIERYGMVLKLDQSGAIVECLRDPSGKVWSVTNAVPWKHFLFLGSLRSNAIARYDLQSGTRANAN